ncbi:MAG: hypothetical protein M3548_20270 [Actinomycetota bacterium]|nr:hypothetical protein [Actinomycetota bacterium]
MNITARLVVLLVAQSTEIARLHRHIHAINDHHRVETARLTARLSDPDDGWSPDAEDCGACGEDLCRYHRGVDAGIGHLVAVVRAIGDDPELMNDILRGGE